MVWNSRGRLARTRRDMSVERWAALKLLAFDVDGTLTDGSLTFDADGKLYQTFNVRDGFALVAARRAGLQIAWISGRPSAVAQRRFDELQLHHCLLACADKARAIRDLRATLGLSPDECCFVGDDLPDLPAFRECGVRVAVADAVSEVIEHADYVTQAPGGRGAVREVIEEVLVAQGHWSVLLDTFTREDVADEEDGESPEPENLQV